MPRKDLGGGPRPTPVALQPSVLLLVSAIGHCGLFLFPDCRVHTGSHEPPAQSLTGLSG